MAQPPKIVIPGLNRGAGVPPGYVLGRLPGTGHGPAQLLNLNALRKVGLATASGATQSTSVAISTAQSLTASLSTAVSGSISSVVSVNTAQSTSLSQISSSLSGAISSTASLSTAVSTVISGSISTVNSRIDSLSTAVGSGSTVNIKDEGSAINTASTLNFVGAGVDATDAGGGTATITIPGGGSGVDVEDEGGAVATATTLNFVGAGVDATDAGGGVVDVTIPGGSGSESSALFEDQKAANTAGGTSTSGSWIARTLNTEVYDDIGLALLNSTVTITIASPAVISWTGHGLILNSTVVFTTTGALPTGITAGTSYFVISAGLGANSFEISASPGGAAINTSGSQSGVHTATASAISLAAGTYEVAAWVPIWRSDRCRARLRDITNSTTLALSICGYFPISVNANSTNLTIHTRFTLAGTAICQLEYRITTGLASQGLGVESNFGEIETYSRLKLTQIS